MVSTRSRRGPLWVALGAAAALLAVWGVVAATIVSGGGRSTAVKAERTTTHTRMELAVRPDDAETMRGVGAVVSERASAAMLGDVTVRTVRPGLLAVTAKATRDAGSVLRGVARPGRLTIRAITRTARAGDDPSSPSSHSPPSCAELGGRAATSDDPSRELIACDATGAAPYVLAPAAVMAAGMSSVTWSQDGGFVVEFTDAGQRAFTALTRSALNKQVAVVLDGAILAAPTVEAVINGSASFRTSLDDVHTRVLRGLLAAGPLEATVTVGRITTV